jgi:hypothetical protein
MPVTERQDYTSRDFDTFKLKLINYMKARFPSVSNSFFEDEYVVVLIELMAYMGDQLAFYTDMAFNETHWDYVSYRPNIVALCKLLGYTPKGLSAAYITVDCEAPTYSGNIEIQKNETIVNGNLSWISLEQRTITGDTNFSLNLIQGVLKKDTVFSDGIVGLRVRSAYNSVAFNTNVVVRVGGVVWSRVDFLWEQNAGRYYELLFEGDGSFQVLFGDGVHGDIPSAGSEIEIEYTITEGKKGNVPSLVGSFQANLSGGSGVQVTFSSNSPASGGAEEESIDEIRVNAPRAFQSHTGLITVSDVEGFVNGVAGVAKSKVVNDTNTKETFVYVMTDGYNETPQSMLDALHAQITENLVMGTILRMRTATLCKLDLGGVIHCYPNYATAEVRDNLDLALHEYLQPEDPSKTPRNIGDYVRISDIIHLLDAVEGVDYLDLTKMTLQPEATLVRWSGDSTFVNMEISETITEELWTICFLTPTTFSVTGSLSGNQADGIVGTDYINNNGALSFKITPNSVVNSVGDIATIRTSNYYGEIALLPTEYILVGEESFDLTYT